ncbi:sensor histidine kinase [Streptomyces gamaensis]|uniref:histidine kinase n=1 Tax=Streptomyces gamaensis TaxID=1763542 RepID=A0ABW0Z1B7_9ACTN
MSLTRTPSEKRIDAAVTALAGVLAVALAGALVAVRAGTYDPSNVPMFLFPPRPVGAGLLSPLDRLLSTLPAGSGEALLALLASGLLWWRRRWPATVAVLLLALGFVTPAVAAPALVALFTVAALRPVRVTGWIATAAALPVPVHILATYGTHIRWAVLVSPLITWALVAAPVGWGLFVRSRRMLVASLTERARRAEEEAARHAREAQQRAREEIAREMHDVLAHRLSLLSVQAGALEFSPRSAPERLERAAGVIRANAHEALQDLRGVIGVLRTPADGEAETELPAADGPGPERPAGQEHPVERPQPVLADLERLARESRAAGMELTLHQVIAEGRDLPALAGRTAYRIVQEGLTNARKHAPGSPVHVEVTADPDTGVDIIVRNALPAPRTATEVPGGGHGLIGLAERAALAGGQLHHGPAGDDYLLQAWLPWSA